MSRLSKLSIPGCVWSASEGVFDVSDPHRLTQAAGYLKFIYKGAGPVYYRGEVENFPSLVASLHRGIRLESTVRKRSHQLHGFTKEAVATGSFLPKVPAYAREPILQQYGIRTEWVDLVDNIWVALWFGCYGARTTGSLSQFVSFERRRQSGSISSNREYAYVKLVHCPDVLRDAARPGVLQSEALEVIDLRTAIPSLYLRPHAQHGLLLRGRSSFEKSSWDLSQCVVGVIRIPVDLASEWIGAGTMLSVHALFPPPHFDYGYAQLLKRVPEGTKVLGAIQHVGA